MKKNLLLAAGFACALSAAAFADCVCNTQGCEPCDSAEDYMEDVGKHLKKQAKKINTHTSDAQSVCQEGTPAYWEEDVAVIGQNAAIILDYADLLDDDVVMTSAQKKQAQSDALKFKQTGQQIKDKAAEAKKQCDTVLAATGQTNTISSDKMHRKKHKAHHQMHQYPIYTGDFLIESMANNGDMLIQVGDFMLENIAK